MFTDYWEVADDSEIWPLMIGKSSEDDDDTRHQISVILNDIPCGNRVLEVGAGIGRLLRAVSMSGRFAESIGIDSSMSLVLSSQKYLEGRARVDLGDGLRLPYPDDYFDFVYSFTCLQHMISLAIIHRNLREIRRVLAPGGLCRVQTISSAGADPRDLKTYDGRVFRDGEEFAGQFKAVGLTVMDIREGITHPKHLWLTARKG